MRLKVEHLDLARLRWKYETILALRLRPKSQAVPVQELRALAREFPGALRDLDSLALASIHDRIDEIVGAELDPSKTAHWMLAELTYAHAMRGVKAVKAWLRGRRAIDDAIREAFSVALTSFAHRDEARAWTNELADIAAPERGRLVPLGLRRVASALGVSESEARRLVFRNDARSAGKVERAAGETVQVLEGVEGVLPPDEPLPPPPSDFLLELSPLDDEEEDESDDVEGVVDDEVEGGDEPDEPDDGLDEE